MRNIRRVAATIALLLGAAPAFGQSTGTLNLQGPSTNSSAPQITSVTQLNGPINTALAAKADATGGVLTNPTVTGTVALGAGANVRALMVPFTTALPGAVPAPVSVLGYCLHDNGGWAACAGSGTPGGSNGNIQFNNSGAFGGIATTGTGNAVLATSPTIATPVLTGATNLSGWLGPYGAFYSSTGAAGAPTNGGTAYSTNDVLTVSGGTCSTAPTLSVLSQSGGVITRFGVQTRGVCTVAPSVPVSVTGGTGSGATFPIVFGPLASDILTDTASGGGAGNVFIATGTIPLTNSINAVELTAIGYRACAGQVAAAETTCLGWGAGGLGDSAFSVYLGGAAVNLLQTGTGASITATETSGSVNSPLTIAAPGSGYPNGTFALTFTGGGCTGVAGTWTVSASFTGPVASTNLTNAGTGCTSAPTVALWPISATAINVNNVASGTDALRRAAWASSVTAIGTGSCRYCGWNTPLAASGYVGDITAVGANAENYNADYVTTQDFGVGIGNNACQGASSSNLPVGYFPRVTCLGAQTGAFLTTGAANDLIIGEGAGNVTMATGSGVVLISPGGNANCDTPASGTSNYFALCGAGNPAAWFSATGTNVASTTVATVAGSLVLGAATGGSQGGGTVNAQNLYINGVAVSTGGYAGVYGASISSNKTPQAGGSGYAVGDQLTLADGCPTSAVLTVAVVTAGAVANYNIANPGSCTTLPSNPVAVTSSTGTGTGAAFTMVYAPLSASLLPPSSANNQANLYLSTNPQAGLYGAGDLFAGILAGGALTTTSASVIAIGDLSCGGFNGTPFAASSLICLGNKTGDNLASGAANDILIGAASNLTSAISGTNNVLVAPGHGPLSVTSGSYNIAISGGPTLTTGIANVIVGDNSDVTASGVNYAVIIGGGGSGGAKGARGGTNSVVIGGGVTGSASLTGTGVTVLGYQAAPTNCTTGNNVLILGSGVDCSAAAVANEIDMGTGGNTVFRVTGVNTPSTSVTTILGTETVTGATTLSSTLTAASLSTVGTIAGSICATSGGLILYESGSTGCTISLEELKRDIEPISRETAMRDVMALRPIAYQMKEGTRGRQMGLGAHQVHDVDPTLSTFNGRGELQAFDPNGILAELVAVVQEQQATIADLKARMH
jgi:hypothetical protein